MEGKKKGGREGERVTAGAGARKGVLGQSKDSVKVELQKLPKCMQQFVDKDVRQSMSSATYVCICPLCVYVCVFVCMCVCQTVSCDSKLMRCLHIWSAVATERDRKKERTKLHNKFHFELLTFNSNGHAPSQFPLEHSNCSCNLQHSNCNCNLQLLRIVINFLTVACLVSSRAVNWQIKRIVPASAGLVKPTAQARQQ